MSKMAEGEWCAWRDAIAKSVKATLHTARILYLKTTLPSTRVNIAYGSEELLNTAI
jgi:hypothetical protein